MKYENVDLIDLRADFVAHGEIRHVDAQTVTVGGGFPAGLELSLRPGTRVFVLTEDELIDLVETARSDGRCDHE